MKNCRLEGHSTTHRILEGPIRFKVKLSECLYVVPVRYTKWHEEKAIFLRKNDKNEKILNETHMSCVEQ
jgi:hypothetical protein